MNRSMIQSFSIRTTETQKANGALQTSLWRPRIVYHGDFSTNRRGIDADHSRVEKYRPNSLEDVSGHQDILTTLIKFVDTNVGCPKRDIDLPLTHMCTAATSSPSVRATWDRQDVHYFSTGQADIR